MTNEDKEIYSNLMRLRQQVDATMSAMQAGIPMFQIKPSEAGKEVHKGYEIGDFVITPRFPKTDFQG